MTAQTNGTIWAKTVSVADNTKTDSLEINSKEVYRRQFIQNALNRATTLSIKHISSGTYYEQLKGSDVDIDMKFIKK